MRNVIWILLLFLASSSQMSCSSNAAEHSTEKKGSKIKVKVRKLKPEKIEVSKIYFAKANFHQQMTYVAEMAGEVLAAHVKTGQKIRKGEILFAYPPLNHNLRIEQAKLTYQELKDTYERKAKLFEIGAVARVELKNVRTQMEVQQKVMEHLQKQNVITAPFSGIVTDVFVHLNQEVEAEDKICSIANTEQLKMSFYVPIKEIDEIQIGNAVRFSYRGADFEGKISEKAMQMHPEKKQYHVEACFTNVPNFSLSGSTIQVEVVSKVKENVFVIPRSVTQKKKDAYYAYFVKNNKVEAFPLKNYSLLGMNFLLEQEMEKQKMLIVEGVDKISHGDQIEIVH